MAKIGVQLAEVPIMGRIIAPRPATPGLEIAGEIVKPAAGSSLKRGQLVCGAPLGGHAAAGGLAEYVVAAKDAVVAVPEGISAVDAASLPVAAVTAYQSLVPFVKAGDHVLFVSRRSTVDAN
jgi:NADPH:quinone reductase-like Zn-dependent oxidoreductase